MNTLHRYGYCNSSDVQTWSKVYCDFDTCYSDYVVMMSYLHDIGTNLASMKWRGVFNLDQAALLEHDKNTNADKLYVEGEAD